MISRFLALTLLLTGTLTSCDPQTFNEILGTATGGVTEAEVAGGLKDALEQGAVHGADIVSKVNGYYGNPLIKILLPEEAEPVVNTLSKIPGGQKLIDDAVLAINRAAEEAAREAAPIFVHAITSLTFRDVMDILFGADDAATRYLDRTTTPRLTARFTPVIEEAMEKTHATRYWDDVMTRYNKIPFVKEVDPDLSAFVTAKALDGLFHMVEKEEAKIRSNVSARTTPLMKKVFAYYDENK